LKSSSLTRPQLYVKIELVRRLRPGCAGIFDYRIFFNAHSCRLEPQHGWLIRWNGFGKNNVFPPKLCVIGKLPVEVKSRPAFTVAFSGQPFQYHHIGWGRRRFRAQLIHERVLLEKPFLDVIIFWGSHDDLLIYPEIVKLSLSYSSLLDTVRKQHLPTRRGSDKLEFFRALPDWRATTTKLTV